MDNLKSSHLSCRRKSAGTAFLYNDYMSINHCMCVTLYVYKKACMSLKEWFVYRTNAEFFAPC